MAVTMVIGNSSTVLSPSLFTPGYTMASAIANQFTEADKEIYFSAIVEVALVAARGRRGRTSLRDCWSGARPRGPGVAAVRAG